MRWSFKTLHELSAEELLEILRLRVDVFVVEQQCPYPEVDDQDRVAIHVSGHAPNGVLIAYARVLPPMIDGLPHIGRVVVHAAHRRQGIASILMRTALECVRSAHGTERCALAAQHHLQQFYEAHGFKVIGEPYDMDGIPHVDMVRKADDPSATA